MDFSPKKIFTIPNLISFFRLALIPAIIYSFVTLKNNYLTVGLTVLSGLTDIVDGKIARKFNMTSDLGKMLDPVADKLTQLALVVCLISKYPIMKRLAILLVAKELIMAITGFFAVKSQNKVDSAVWHGKLCTVVIYISMVLIILFPSVPDMFVTIIAIVCSFLMVFSLVLYVKDRIKLIKDSRYKNEKYSCK